MLVHEPSGGRERVEAVDADGIVHGRRVGEGEADPLPDGARARGQPLERGAVRGQPGLVGRGELAQRVIPAAGPGGPRSGGAPARAESRAAIRVLTVEMICQVPDPVAPADLVQGLRWTSSSERVVSRAPGGGALHDEGGHPFGHLRPHEAGQRRDLVGRNVVRHRPEEPRAVVELG